MIDHYTIRKRIKELIEQEFKDVEYGGDNVIYFHGKKPFTKDGAVIQIILSEKWEGDEKE